MGQHRNHTSSGWIAEAVMLARQIKDLSIALEALSRIQHIEECLFNAVQSLLTDKVEQLEREHREERLAKITSAAQDDTIPF